MIGSILLNRYKIETELGRGGMGIVYKAHDTLLNRAVAIKFLNTEGVGSEGKARLLQEARAAAQLNHPNIVSIYDAGEADENSFIVMELVNGDTLRKTKKPTLQDVVSMAQQICLALEHAHANGIIHRDLKLENIVITNTQILKLMDFGLARTANDVHLTEEGVITGTFAYIAPELIQGQPASSQSDLYAFGVILYELLTDQSPFEGTVNTILAQHLHAIVKPPADINPQIPTWLNDLVLRLLNKLPEERPASAKEVLGLLNQKSESSAITVAFTVSPKSKNNLPVQLTSFIGREKALEELEKVLSQHRLVTLTGSGGTGKTRLSLQLAENVFNQFDYIWFIELAPIIDPDHIPHAILSAMGISEQQGKSAQELINDYLQDKNTLIILDNCEHLIEASAKISYALLNHAPMLKILASSREALGVKGEMAWHVPSLSVPDINHLPEFNALSQYESLRLFVERATLAKPNFTATKENASFIAQICFRLDGIPLAIELAASRIKALSVDQISARLDDRFRLLTGGSRTSLPRQQTLRATIDWSYNLLTEPEQALLRHLTVFSGGWTLEAAESVCSQDGSGLDILDLLTQLVDKSLVNLKDSRYRILETTRQYAREKLLDSGEASALHDKHLNYFLNFVKDAEKELHGPNQPQWLKSLNAMHDNLHAALEWAVESRLTESALKLAQRLDRYWHMRSDFTEGRQWLERVLALPDALQHTESYTQALTQLATITWLQIDAKAARPAAEKALSIARDHNDKWNIARALDILGLILTSEENFAAAETALEESKALFQEVGDAWGHAHTVISLGWAAFMQGDLVKALEIHEQALMLFRQVGDPFFQCIALSSIGRIYVMHKDVKQGLAPLREALIIAQQMESIFEIAATLNGYGEAMQLMEKPARAVHLFWAARNLYDSIGVWTEADNPEFENRLAPCRAMLGESEFAEAVERGRAMTMEMAIQLALGE